MNCIKNVLHKKWAYKKWNYKNELIKNECIKRTYKKRTDPYTRHHTLDITHSTSHTWSLNFSKLHPLSNKSPKSESK